MIALLLAVLFAAPPEIGFRVIRVLATADVHGRVRPSPDFEAPGLPRRVLGGWENLERAVRRERTDFTLLLDCGDFAAGAPECNVTYGRVAVRFMNELAYDAAALGARDFTWGIENLEVLTNLANFPLLGDPMLDVVLNRRLPRFRPYVLKPIAGIKVALVALTDPAIPDANRAADVRGFAPGSPASQLRRYLPAIHSDTAVEVIIAFGHIASSVAAALLDSFPELDLVICPEDGGEAEREQLVTVAPYGMRLSVIDLLWSHDDRRVYHVAAQTVNVRVQPVDSCAATRLIAESRVEDMDSIVSFGAVEMDPDTLGFLVAEAARRVHRADIAVLPKNVVEGRLRYGDLRGYELHNLVPFGDKLRLVLLGDTLLHRLVTGIGPAEPAPLLAGADYFVLGATTAWLKAGAIARVRFAQRKPLYRVVTTQRLLERTGIRDLGRLLESDLTHTWFDWASSQDTLRPVEGPRLYPATPGLLMPAVHETGPVNLNTASAEQLQTLPGIGPKTAERIIAYRETHGSFNSVNELSRVKGIGPKKTEKIKPLAVVR
jgi:competence protein ComEA